MTINSSQRYVKNLRATERMSMNFPILTGSVGYLNFIGLC